MSQTAFAGELLGQLSRQMKMLEELVDLFDDQAWREGAGPGREPARWAFHAVLSVDHLLSPDPNSFPWGRVPNWQGDVASLPSREELKDYGRDVLKKMQDHWSPISNQEMLGPSPIAWAGETAAGQFAYCLRHLSYHLGEVAMLARLSGSYEAPWR